MNIKEVIISKLTRLAKKDVKEDMLLSELKIDSLDLAELIYEAEVSYGILFDASKFNDIKTVRDIINIIEESYNGNKSNS
ncbi:hypothetical protein MM26B8_01160 [Mycoplasmopsis meleagridis]|uniref:acyl carrier protein n=1 Tax=Mycoplasmopsis meleagridis TaxID=29561 RepID=UPI0007C3241A|nr:acyl carrier protein [Mycoplasmopsis meleagridis]OAD18492.1 hypothetical protein MM26B8_01160 [Mycoplasmopsis meleagridis]